jgi:phenylacetic acid degradation operon negative regulatory protein
MDVCGYYLRPLGGWFPVARLIVLMAQLGVDEQAVRSVVSRITKRGMLEPETCDGVRGYRLAAAAGPLLDDADRRIFAGQSRGTLADGWVLVAFSVPEEDRDKRYLLRSRLSWLGFGMHSNGLWLAPARLTDELEDSIRQMGFEQYATVFRAHHRGFGDPRSLVERCWDLPGLRRMYTDFLVRWQPVQQKWHRSRPADGVEAFVDCTLLLHQWRRFPYLDPGLPLEILPPHWEGQRAAEVFFDLRERLADAAMSHVVATVAPERPAI